jgi:hypothetical protein
MAAENILEIMKDLDAQWNAHDVDGALAYYTDDAVVTLNPPPPGQPAVSQGKAAVRDFIVANIPGFQIESREPEVSGDRARWLGRLSNDGFRQLGLAGLEIVTEATFRGDKVSSFTVTFTPEALEQIMAALARAGLVGSPR